jgi:hypothetical protein
MDLSLHFVGNGLECNQVRAGTCKDLQPAPVEVLQFLRCDVSSIRSTVISKM